MTHMEEIRVLDTSSANEENQQSSHDGIVSFKIGWQDIHRDWHKELPEYLRAEATLGKLASCDRTASILVKKLAAAVSNGNTNTEFKCDKENVELFSKAKDLPEDFAFTLGVVWYGKVVTRTISKELALQIRKLIPSELFTLCVNLSRHSAPQAQFPAQYESLKDVFIQEGNHVLAEWLAFSTGENHKLAKLLFPKTDFEVSRDSQSLKHSSDLVKAVFQSLTQRNSVHAN